MNICFEEIGLIGDIHAEADYLEIALHFFQMAQDNRQITHYGCTSHDR